MTPQTPLPVILVPGFWLGAWAWDDVLPSLRAGGLDLYPVTLPGLDSPTTDRRGLTLADHVRHVRALVERLVAQDAAQQVVLVGHSGGAAVVHGVVDQVPTAVRRAIYVDSGPQTDGTAIAPGLPADLVDLPLPPFDELEAQGSSLAGITPDGLATFRARAVPHPAGVGRSPQSLHDERRLEVPVTVICSSISAEQLRAMAHPGPPLFTELASLDVTWVDLPTGHWPMFSEPARLGEEIVRAATA